MPKLSAAILTVLNFVAFVALFGLIYANMTHARLHALGHYLIGGMLFGAFAVAIAESGTSNILWRRFAKLFTGFTALLLAYAMSLVIGRFQ